MPLLLIIHLLKSLSVNTLRRNTPTRINFMFTPQKEKESIIFNKTIKDEKVILYFDNELTNYLLENRRN